MSGAMCGCNFTAPRFAVLSSDTDMTLPFALCVELLNYGPLLKFWIPGCGGGCVMEKCEIASDEGRGRRRSFDSGDGRGRAT